MDETESTSTRRGLLRRGLTLAAAAPVIAVGLHTSTVWATGDDDDENGNRGRGNGGQNGRGNDDRDNENDDEGAPQIRFSAGLCRVSEASGFSASSPGTDPLSSGRVRLRGSDERVAVVLRGATPNDSYEVWFAPASGDREFLGNIGQTNGRGDLVAVTPNALSGARRVGSFVLRRGGNDQFVSCLGD